MPEKNDNGEISITDINGRNVYRSQLNLRQGINTIPVDVTNLANGTYFINLQMTDKSFMKKLNKQ